MFVECLEKYAYVLKINKLNNYLVTYTVIFCLIHLSMQGWVKPLFSKSWHAPTNLLFDQF